jgi:DNA-directed RNA polymerase subunit D
LGPMNIQLLEKDGERLSFIIRGISIETANALRRTMLSEVPCMAIDDVVMIENSSIMHDEVLAHRLGLVPLRTDLDAYVFPEECDCNSELGCSKCRSILTLEAEATDETRTVYSGELKPTDQLTSTSNDRIPIVKLAPGQKIKLEAYARLGTGKMHAKWQAAAVSAYKFIPVVSVDEEKCRGVKECVRVCPKDVFEVSSGKAKVVRLLSCIECLDCVKACPNGAITVDWEKDGFIFNVESAGFMSPEEVVLRALDVLKSKAEEFASEVGELD